MTKNWKKKHWSGNDTIRGIKNVAPEKKLHAGGDKNNPSSRKYCNFEGEKKHPKHEQHKKKHYNRFEVKSQWMHIREIERYRRDDNTDIELSIGTWWAKGSNRLTKIAGRAHWLVKKRRGVKWSLWLGLQSFSI
jgi:hypothetical protein